MKNYTDLEQSKKLSEILPLESADMIYMPMMDIDPMSNSVFFDIPECYPFNVFKDSNNKPLPCWSLTTLLDVLLYPQLSKDKLGSGKEGWMVSAYPDNCRYDSCWHDNPVDACVEMIMKLHELKML